VLAVYRVSDERKDRQTDGQSDRPMLYAYLHGLQLVTSYDDDERVNNTWRRRQNSHLRDVIMSSPYATLGRRGHVTRSEPISSSRGGSLARPPAPPHTRLTDGTPTSCWFKAALHDTDIDTARMSVSMSVSWNAAFTSQHVTGTITVIFVVHIYIEWLNLSLLPFSAKCSAHYPCAGGRAQRITLTLTLTLTLFCAFVQKFIRKFSSVAVAVLNVTLAVLAGTFIF